MSAGSRSAVEAYEALAPDDAAWARRAVEPYAGMSPAERLRALAARKGGMDLAYVRGTLRALLPDGDGRHAAFERLAGDGGPGA